jgi:F0F1-type ATP synthase assembly protein I
MTTSSSYSLPRMVRSQYLAPIVVGGVMAYLSSRSLFVGSGLSLIPWAILGMSWGFISRDRPKRASSAPSTASHSASSFSGSTPRAAPHLPISLSSCW